MTLEQYIAALNKIDGYLWEVIGAMKADILCSNTHQGEQTEGVDLRKLKYGQGCIVQKQRVRPNGTIYKWYEGKVKRDGKLCYVTGTTKELCYQKLKKIQDRPAIAQSNCFTFEQWIKKWLDVYKSNVKPKTKQDYLQAFNYYLGNLKNKHLNSLKAIDLQNVINTVAQEYPRRARTVYDLAHGALTEAWNNDYIKKDVAKALKRPAMGEPQEETPLTLEQQQALMNLQEEKWRHIFTAYIWSGCRFSELLTLRPEFWDREKGTLYIEGTKTKTSKRTIPVFPPLQAVLEQLPMQGEFMFDVAEKTLKRHKDLIEKQVGFKFTFKALRHTFNQNLTEMDVPDIVRAAWMGHSKPTTTKKTYTHLTNRLQENAIQIVLQNLQKKGSDTLSVVPTISTTN